MTQLTLIHRPRNGNALEDSLMHVQSQIPEFDNVLWSTCLRQIAFVYSPDVGQIKNFLQESDEVLQGEEAFGFILEVVCGLKSPLLGETEVQGQFKTFVASLPEKSPQIWGVFASFFQGILSESKRVRTVHLKNLGSQSYGSLIRRRLKSDEAVAIVGAGQLTQEILPWLKQASKIQIHARRPERALAFSAGYEQVEVRGWPQSPDLDVLVLAAPVSNAELLETLKRNLINRPPQRVIDLRGEERLGSDHLETLGLAPDMYESLQELMNEISSDLARIGEKVSEARQHIGRCGEAFMGRAVCRPGGWEDLCG